MDYATTKTVPGVGKPDGDARLIDLRSIGATIRRRRWWIVGISLVILAITALAYAMTPKLYTANASLALDRKVDEIVRDQGTAQSLTTDSPTVDTAVQVLTSSALAAEVADRLQLPRSVATAATADGLPLTADQARRRAIALVASGLTVKRIGTSYAIQVSYTGRDRIQAADIVNALITQYVDDQRTGQVGQRSRETQLLAQRIANLRGEVQRTESAVARYRAATNLIDIQKDSTAVQQEISVLNTQLATAQAEEAAARARAATSGPRNGGSDASNSPLIRELRSQEAQLSTQRADLAGRYGPLHPDLARVDRQLQDVQRSITAEAGRAQAGLSGDVQVAAGRTSAIRSSLARAQGGLMAGNNASVQLNELLRNAESARSLYQTLLDRYRQAVAGQGTEQSNAYVIAKALAPGGPSSPNLPLFVVGGILAALLAATGAVLVLEMMESGLKTRADAESALGLPVVANVPDLATVPGVTKPHGGPLGPADYLIGHDASIFGEAFRSMRTALRLGHADQGVRSLAICSALPAEGKTTVAICLARSAALSGLKVVLVDCDVRQRASSRSMAANAAGAGLLDVLKGETTIDAALIRDEASGMSILAQNAAATGDYDKLTSEAMQQLIADLSGRFDLVVLDTAPVLPLAEARAVAGMADGVLLVTRWRTTPADAAKLALEMLNRAGANVRGVVLSLVNLKQQAASGYGDEMMYYKKFEKYYIER